MDENANCPRRGSGLTSGPSIRIGQLTAAGALTPGDLKPFLSP